MAAVRQAPLRWASTILLVGVTVGAACHRAGPAAPADAGPSSPHGQWYLEQQDESGSPRQPGTPDVGIVGPVGNGAPSPSESRGIGPNRDASGGTVDGVVQKVDVPSGLLIVQTRKGAVALRGLPDQLSKLTVGEPFRGAYQTYGVGVRWLVIGPAPRATLGRPGRAAGTIEAVDEVNGIVTMDETAAKTRERRTFHAHPGQLQTLIPGQVVKIWYRQLNGECWIQRYAGN